MILSVLMSNPAPVLAFVAVTCTLLAVMLPRLQRVSRLAAWVPRYDRSRELLRLRLLIEGMQAFVRSSPG